MTTARLTPVRRQYLTIKHSYSDAILLFRMGDFYEAFDDDARLLSTALDITLTSRTMGKDTRVPMAGVPAVSLEANLARLIRHGHKVAICEQLSDPALSKGLVERGVVRVVTPGTVLESSLLDQDSNNYLAAVCGNGEQVGLAYVDCTTGEFAAAQFPTDQLPAELARLNPSELIYPTTGDSGSLLAGHQIPTPATEWDASAFDPELATRALLDYFGVLSLEAYGAESIPLGVRAAGAIIDYLRWAYKREQPQLAPLSIYNPTSFMRLDPQTRRNLELFEAGRWDNREFSLLATLDDTRTSMGARLLRRWLGQPLLDLEPLERRLAAVQFFHDDAFLRTEATSALSRVADLERILSRIQAQTATPRELVALLSSLRAAADLLNGLSGDGACDLTWLANSLKPIPEVAALVENAIAPEPAGQPGDGGVIREGFSVDLDKLRTLANNARGFIAGLETKERERTGIRNLRIGYNQVFGYYIEVSQSNLQSVPDDYQRRQTLAGGERYITPKLKEYEDQVVNASDRLNELERSLYQQVGRQIADSGAAISRLALGIARLDVFVALANVAVRYGYVKPTLSTGNAIRITEGRHPVVERVLDAGAFVPNDSELDSDDAQIMLISGPNMAGKSTYIRQVAIIVLMAQMGSFVPARTADISLVDRIFTRVGLQDDLTTGQSTFMVEMVETASILNQATRRSLVILDEVGRGTSTYDGLSIAHAVVEHLHNNPRLGCKTLFATHYHELTELAATLPGVRNYNVAVTEDDGQIVFLRRIIPGGADRSYGVHVARLAGMPRAVVNRAQELLTVLEGAGKNRTNQRSNGSSEPAASQQLQMPLFGSGDDELVQAVMEMDIANLTPLESISKLYELQEQARLRNRHQS